MADHRRAELRTLADRLYAGSAADDLLPTGDQARFLSFASGYRRRVSAPSRWSDRRGCGVVSHGRPPLGSEIEKSMLVDQYLRGSDPVMQWTMTVAITYACSCGCRHCYTSRYGDPRRRELEPEEFREIFERINDELAVWHIDITGGEPLEHPSFFPIVDGIPPDRATALVATNGTLITESMADRIRAANIMACKVSLDAPSGEKHDRSRAMPGAFERAREGIRLLVDRRVLVFVQSFIERGCSATDDLERLVDTCRSLGVAFVHLITPLMTGRLEGRSDLLLRPEDRLQLYRLLERYRREDDFLLAVFPDWELEREGCLAGRGRVYVNPYGDVYACNFHGSRSYGNALTDDLAGMIRAMQSDIPAGSRRCPASMVEGSDIRTFRERARGSAAVARGHGAPP